MTTNGKAECQNCRFSARDQNDMICRRNPPQLFVMPTKLGQIGFMSRFPGVIAQMWCGQHARNMPGLGDTSPIVNTAKVNP